MREPDQNDQPPARRRPRRGAPAVVLVIATALAVASTPFVATPVVAQADATEPGEADDLMPLMLDLAGEWTGALEYVDYGTGQRQRIPLRARVGATPDRAFLIRDLTFTDPGVEVHAKEIVTIEPWSGQVVAGYFREHQVEQFRFDVTEREITDASNWSITLETDGSDDNRPAHIRIVQSLRDGELQTTKLVRFTDDDSAEWTFRNETRVTRARPDAAALVGRWRVDLRPTPDAEPYYQEMVIESVDDGKLQGTFYGATVAEARINADWGPVRFAFTTQDGSGPYFTTGTLRGDRIEGVTHSIGRDFLSVWSAERVERVERAERAE